jgi:hypothetical protein
MEAVKNIQENDLQEIIKKAVFKTLHETRTVEDNIYSFSRLTTASCMKRFYHKYVLKEDEPSGPAATQGKIVHEAIAGIIDLNRLSEIVVPDSFDIDKELTNANIKLALVEKLVLAANATPEMGNVETHYTLPLNPEDPFSPTLQVYIDLEVPKSDNSRGSILDWKTSQKDFEVTDTPQLGLYAWAVSQAHGYEEVEAGLRFLRFKGKKGTKKHVFTSTEMEETRQWAYSLAYDIESRLGQLEFGGDPDTLFPANPESGHCKYCSFVNDCQKQSETNESSITTSVVDLEKGELSITSHKEAVEVGAEFLRLKSAGDKLLEALKVYCKETGETVIIKDQQYGASTSISWSFTPDQKKNIAKKLAENGVNPWEVLSLGATQLKDKKLTHLSWDESTYEQFGGKKKETIAYRWSRADDEAKIKKEEEKDAKVS